MTRITPHYTESTHRISLPVASASAFASALASASASPRPAYFAAPTLAPCCPLPPQPRARDGQPPPDCAVRRQRAERVRYARRLPPHALPSLFPRQSERSPPWARPQHRGRQT